VWVGSLLRVSNFVPSVVGQFVGKTTTVLKIHGGARVWDGTSAKLKGSNEVTSDPVGPLLTSYVERLEYSCEAALCLRVLAGPAPCLRST
jgi:hypothetical protein